MFIPQLRNYLHFEIDMEFEFNDDKITQFDKQLIFVILF